ncbi:MAG: DUF1631 family protein [Oleiphilaceae bacterium]|nr:DUF1631 family protein [Oleiphilaceae bacterium]
MDSKERRASLRQPIKLAAQLITGPSLGWPCQIADFCAEGLLVRYSDETSRKLERSGVLSRHEQIQVRFRSPDGKKIHMLEVRIVRRVRNTMGLIFTHSNPAALEAMLNQYGAGKGQERAALKPPDKKVQFVLHQCAQALVQNIEPLMDKCFDRMVSDLEQAAQKAPTNQQANDFMDTAGQVLARQKAMWQKMRLALEAPLKPARKETANSSMSLVEKEEFEDWLTLKIMITRADTLYRYALLMLKMRLDNLGVDNATGHANPLGPALVCESFNLALQQLNASRAAEKVCLKAFDERVVQGLEPLYESLNAILVRHGILPDLDVSRQLKGTGTKPPPRSAEKAKAPPQGNEAPLKPKTEKRANAGSSPQQSRQSSDASQAGFRASSQAALSAFVTVKNLLGSLASSRSAGGGSAPASFDAAARPLSAGEFQRELHDLQVHALPSGTETLPLRERVVERVNAIGGTALDEDQQNTLDVVDQFFASVVDNPKLSDTARQQLRHLEVPVLKVMLRDREFLDDRDSPVRGVMNRLAQLGAKGGRSNQVVRRRIDDLVKRISTDFEQDTGVFEGAVAELDGLIERQNLAYRRNVERVTAAAEGSQKVAESKAAVAEAMDQRLAGRQVPRIVLSLLDAGWRDLLSLTWIRQGPDSALWQDYLSVLDSLLAFGEDPEAPINLAELLRVIQDGLASVSSNQVPSSQIRDGLKKFLLRRPGDPLVRVSVEAKPALEIKPVRESEVAERKSRSLQRWVDRARKLRTGDWMCDQEIPDQPQYVRVVWIARGFSRFVFVNHQGMRVVELELEALAGKMQKGIIVPDVHHERPLVDESIDRMVRRVYDQLSWVSTHDELTGLLSRREFERALEQQLAQHEEERSLVRLDLRHFRLLNDTAGYTAGDEALKAVAGILQVDVGEGLPLARLGGNEFGFLVSAEHAESMTKRIISAIENLKLTFAGKQHSLSASAGLAPSLPALVTADRWLRAAEDACNQAKLQGSGQLSFYNLDAQSEVLQEQVAAKIAGLGNLDEERMLLRCQKIIPLQPKTRMAAQYEVLISIYNDTGNLIGAAEFVRMAERYNRMQAVDRWVVGHMLDWLRDSPGASTAVGGICIKLSGYSLNDESLLEFIYDKLSEKDAPIERLWFEITEAAAINNLQSVAEFIEEMKELSCRFCLGHFGSGPTSYQYLRSLPVDLIKIDGTFVKQMTSSETDYAIVRSMVDMAHYMGKEVIASQVETRETLEALRMLGVDYAQGYAIEKPRLLSSLG